MNIEKHELSRPIKIKATLNVDEVKERKKQIFNKIQKTLPQIDGFRKGNIPQNIAEKKFPLEQLYKPLFDDWFLEVKDQEKIVSARDFKIFGDLKEPTEIFMVFIAEIEPVINIPDLKNVKIEHDDNIEINQEELDKEINNMLKTKESMIEVEKSSLENLDVAFMDYKGLIDGNEFKGGTANDYHLTINIEQKSFIDNFEEQMIGMVKNETKTIKVKFPDDYREKSLAGKQADFVVTLKAIKQKVLPNLEDFAKENGFNNIEDYRNSIQEKLYNNKIKNNEDEFKRNIIRELTNASEIPPIPLDMIEQELDREWFSFLNRIGKKEKEYLKENPNGKDDFIARTNNYVVDIIKTRLLLKAIQDKHNITTTKEEVIEKALNSNIIVNQEEKKKWK